MHRSIHRATAALALAVLAAAGLSACTTSDRVQLDFFQFKGEAGADFDRLVAEFEAENPDIDVVLNLVADPETAIRTLLVKDEVPDVITLNGNGNFGQLAEAGVFHDFTGDAAADLVNPAAQQILQDLGTAEGEINALPMISNADGIIYNREIFEAQGLEVPQTWDELIAVCEQLQAAGITPFYGTLADAWTTLPSFNAIGAQLEGQAFFDEIAEAGGSYADADSVSWASSFGPTLERMQELYAFAQPGYGNRGYEDGNAAFAAGESAMLMQGVWAMAPVLDIDPELDISAFPYPVQDDPDETQLVSGVDVAITMGRGTEHPEEAMRLIEFLLQPEHLDDLATSQNMFSASADAGPNANPALQELEPYVTDGRIVGFIDHQIPTSVPMQPILQEFVLGGSVDSALASLDDEWRKVATRLELTEGGA